MTGIPGKLTVGADGRLTGPAHITRNDPWPCPSGNAGVTGRMRGAVEHTMVGSLAGTIAVFNNPANGASAHFGIGQDGTIHQFFPLGQGYEAWHAYAANLEWYGIEFEDNGNPDNPISDAGIAAGAQLMECLSAFAGFPLRVCNDAQSRGFAYHSLAAAWNLSHHTCPDLPPRHVRSAQRAAIIALAKQIRTGAPLPSGIYHADGQTSLSQLAQRQGCDVADIWWHTSYEAIGPAGENQLGPLQRRYLNAGKWDALMPSGTVLWLP